MVNISEEIAMRSARPAFGRIASTALVLGFALACGKDSNSVAGPAVTTTSANLAGTWTGTYASDMSSCASTPMSITLSQDGTRVTGNLTTSSCGPHGLFSATISGNTLTGKVEMLGCTGGSVMGQINGNALSLSVGDFYRPLVTENEVLLQGGSADLRR
jgi:hypothetical protein